MTKSNEKNAPLFVAAELYKTAKALTEAQEKAVKIGNDLQLEYHKIACSHIVHLAKHGDIMPIRQMMETFPKSLRLDSMQKFLITFGQVSQHEDDEGKITYVLDRSKTLKLGEALEPKNAWWKVKAVAEYKPFVFMDELNKLLEKSENKLTKGVSTEKGDRLAHSQVSALRSLVTYLKGDNVVQIKPEAKPEAKPEPARKVAAKAKKPKKA